MKRVFYGFIVVSTMFGLSGCASETVEETLDYDVIYQENYADVEYVPSDGLDFCAIDEEGTQIHIEVDGFNPFSNLEQMIDSQHSKFVYGEIYRTEDYNCIAKSVYLIVYNTEFSDERELIRVSVLHKHYFTDGTGYMLNLVYNEDQDAYFLSQDVDSIFRVNTYGTIQGSFFTEGYPDKIDEFVKQVFE